MMKPSYVVYRRAGEHSFPWFSAVWEAISQRLEQEEQQRNNNKQVKEALFWSPWATGQQICSQLSIQKSAS